jgi:hypothetical protein
MKLILVCVKSTTTYRIFKVSSRLSYHWIDGIAVLINCVGLFSCVSWSYTR